VRIVYGGERVRLEYETAAPDVVESERGLDFRAMSLDALVRMGLTSFRLKGRVPLLDLIEAGLVDESWLARLAEGLRELLEHPEG
jgi:hypothetical protein